MEEDYSKTCYVYATKPGETKLTPVEPNSERGLRKRCTGLEDQFEFALHELPSLVELLKNHGHYEIVISQKKPDEKQYNRKIGNAHYINTDVISVMRYEALDRARHFEEVTKYLAQSRG